MISIDGRNRPDGYGDAAYQYRVFAHSVATDPAKTVDFVVLPANANLHLFALGDRLTPAHAPPHGGRRSGLVRTTPDLPAFRASRGGEHGERRRS